MTKKRFQSEIDALPVFDTHAHIKGHALAAQDFWDIGHYFWFIRELHAAGYPTDPSSLRPAQRIKAFWTAYQRARNTSMHWVVRRILQDLYGIALESESDIRAADEAIKATANDPDWPSRVCSRTHIKRIVTNAPGDAPYPGLDGVSCVVPRLERHLKEGIGHIEASGDQTAGLETAAANLDRTLADFVDLGYPGVMTSDDPFDRLGARTHNPKPLRRTGNTRDDIGVALLHALCESAQSHGLFVQLFAGIEKGWGTLDGGGGVPAYTCDRILNLHGLFHKYDIPFELVLGDGIGNPDAVNAARIFPNVRVGGLWWYNFRASTYRQIMQQRFEALPATRSAIVVSDARCIEWCYGKIVLIKRLLADYLYDQVKEGWIEEQGALAVAQQWLHDSAEELYT